MRMVAAVRCAAAQRVQRVQRALRRTSALDRRAQSTAPSLIAAFASLLIQLLIQQPAGRSTHRQERVGSKLRLDLLLGQLRGRRGRSRRVRGRSSHPGAVLEATRDRQQGSRGRRAQQLRARGENRTSTTDCSRSLSARVQQQRGVRAGSSSGRNNAGSALLLLEREASDHVRRAR